MSATTPLVATPSCAATKMVPMSRLPAMRRWKVGSGISTVASWSWPKPAVPLASSTPMTRQLIWPTRIGWSSGSPAPKSVERTVWPMTQTLPPERASCSEKARPRVTSQLRAAKYSVSVPVTSAVRLSAP